MNNLAIHSIERVISALDELTDEYPDLIGAVDFYEEVLPLLEQSWPSLHGLHLDMNEAGDKLRQGVPLLWGEFSTAAGSAPNMELFLTLCRLATEGGNEDGQVLMQTVLNGDVDLRPLLTAALTLDRATLTTTARSLNIELLTIEAILRHLLMPIVRAYSDAFGQALDFAEWRRGYCPVCGDWPLFGELHGRDRLRHLRCGRCTASWRFKRLECIWCGTTKRDELSFLYELAVQTWRVDVCDHCRGYVKTLVSFDPLEADMLLVHDLRTLHMDQLATDAGYKRPFKQPLASP
ncbi:MAG: formate dehydrogenase accessory protein FdhE [Anaerolineae bacterium]|nr:formate dehydrogenase accessory protein FdhE [Anaerolineae bacterium]